MHIRIPVLRDSFRRGSGRWATYGTGEANAQFRRDRRVQSDIALGDEYVRLCIHVPPHRAGQIVLRGYAAAIRDDGRYVVAHAKCDQSLPLDHPERETLGEVVGKRTYRTWAEANWAAAKQAQ